MMRFLLTLAACTATAGGIYCAGDIGADRVEQALALKCARESIGTDSAIAECFARYSQPCPDDICPKTEGDK